MENLLGVSAPRGHTNLTDSPSERCQVTSATGRQDPPARIWHLLWEPAKLRGPLLPPGETVCALCVHGRCQRPPVQMCQRETGPERSDHQPDPSATHKTWRLESNLFSRRVWAVRRRLSMEGKPTLKSTKEEIHKDTNRSSVPCPAWGLPSLLEKHFVKTRWPFPYEFSVPSQRQRWLPTSSPPPWPSSTHRAGQTQAGDLLK